MSSSSKSYSDQGGMGGSNKTELAFLAANPEGGRVEAYGSGQFRGWEVFDREESQLITGAQSDGYFISNEQEIIDKTGLRGGASEHEVFFSKDRKNVYRRTIGDAYGHPHLKATPAQYLQRLNDFNKIFPSISIEVLGVSLNERGNGVIWTKQPYVQGVHFETSQELYSGLEKEGWTVTGDRLSGSFKHESGIIISDVNQGNIIVANDGSLHFIDVIVEKIPAEQ